MIPNRSSFARIEEEHFLEETRVRAALEKMTNFYLRYDCPANNARLLEELTSAVLSTVSAISKLGQSVSCFCPETTGGGT